MKRTWFMSYLLQTAYNRVALVAVERGTIEGALEISLEKQIKVEHQGIYKEEAEELVHQFGSVRKAAEGVLKSELPEKPWTIEILSTKPFVITKKFPLQIGIASDGTYAAQAWRISNEVFDQIGGQRFAWYGPNGEEYIDHRDNFRRPTEEEIRKYIMPPLLKKAVEFGLITIIKH